MSSTTEGAHAGEKSDDRLSRIMGEGLRRIFPSYRVTLARPEAACAGGPHTLQRIHLITGDRAPLLLGWANATQRRAQLHTLGHTLALSKLRLGTELVMPPLEYARFLETATRLLEDEGMAVSIVAFVKEGADSGVRLRVNAHARSTTLPHHLLDAITAVSTLASRMAESTPVLDEPHDAEPADAADATAPRAATSGWSKVLRWAPSAAVVAPGGAKGEPAR